MLVCRSHRPRATWLVASDAAKQIPQANPQPFGNLFDIDQGQIPRASFKTAVVGTVKLASFRSFLLADALFLAYTANGSAKTDADVGWHCRQLSRSTSDPYTADDSHHSRTVFGYWKPKLDPANLLRGSDLQVIACAGSGKTESISCRVTALIAEGAEPASIVAFTFTDRAAGELKERITHRVAEGMGNAFRDRLGPMFVGTIHAYFFRILQDHKPQYGDYDVLDEQQGAKLLCRNSAKYSWGFVRYPVPGISPLPRTHGYGPHLPVHTRSKCYEHHLRI
jgi:hypothetical protein